MLNISRNPEPWLVELLECVATIAEQQSMEYFVVGAMARDVIFELGHEIAASRRTEDVDLGLRVSSWEQFESIINALINSDRFVKGRQRQRLMFDGFVRLDVVPFGDVADDDQIQWPPDFDFEMDVAGFAEAHQSAIAVQLREDPPLIVPFASPSGLAAMKIIAWSERDAHLREKDASDLAFILRHYLDIEGLERITTDFPDWLDEDFDYDLASATLLGVDLGKVMRGGSIERLTGVLKTQLAAELDAPLISDMVPGVGKSEARVATLGLLRALFLGLSLVSKQR